MLQVAVCIYRRHNIVRRMSKVNNENRHSLSSSEKSKLLNFIKKRKTSVRLLEYIYMDYIRAMQLLPYDSMSFNTHIHPSILLKEFTHEN